MNKALVYVLAGIVTSCLCSEPEKKWTHDPYRMQEIRPIGSAPRDPMDNKTTKHIHPVMLAVYRKIRNS